ncbi:MAG: glycine zipper 2TM domain-containing protein [Gammaproteobacteria bacterium]|nr:glycine zipper 2TM domain-containing protein [Gammaproteobacteria bacterium]
MKPVKQLLSMSFLVLSLSAATTWASDDRPRHSGRHDGAPNYSEPRTNHHRHPGRGHPGYQGRVQYYPVYHRPSYRHHVHSRHCGHRNVTVIQEHNHYSGVASYGHGHYSGVGTIAGAMVGGVIGHDLGHGDPASTAAGAVIGAVIGQSLDHHHTRHYSYRSY